MMSSNDLPWQWSSRKDSSKRDTRKWLIRTEVLDHPLKHFTIKVSKSARSKKHGHVKSNMKNEIFNDPLGVVMDGEDPLSAFQKQTNTTFISDDWSSDLADNVTIKGLEPWSIRKETILSKFPLTEILTLTTHFSLQDKGVSSLRGRPSSGRTTDYEEGILVYEINDITAEDYFHRTKKFHDEVIRTWNDDQRVKSLKIVIQCSKLLTDSYETKFYANKFIYITDILDTFGNLVFKRIKEKSEVPSKSGIFVKMIKKLPDNFTPDMVSESAKETCRNWFLKIASIRELIPRLYVEASLIKVYSFITIGENGEVLARLTKMTRGIGDPLVALYMRCYLCRIGVANGIEDYDYFKDNFEEFLIVYYKLFNRNIHLSKQIELFRYLESFLPALNWILQGLISKNSELQDEIYKTCRQKQNNGLLLWSILHSFKLDYIVDHVTEILDWMVAVNKDEVKLYELLVQLGRCYQQYTKRNNVKVSIDVLNNIWSMISHITYCSHYMACIEYWFPVSVISLPVKAINILLDDIMLHVSESNSYELYYPQLEKVVTDLTDNIEDYISLFIMEKFVQFLNTFRSDAVKVSSCKIIMKGFASRCQDLLISDTVIINNLMVVAKTLHDSVNALTVEDERKQISDLISFFVRKVDFGRDFESLLSFYVEARGSFLNLDAVHATLVQCVNKLSCVMLKLVRCRHNSKTSSFVKACAAYCYITIPSIASPLVKLQLYILSGQVALANNCLGQADAFFKAILNTIPEVLSADLEVKSKTLESLVVSYIKEILSLFLVVPDNPSDASTIFLVRALIKTIQKCEWQDNITTKARLFMNVLDLLSVAIQDTYPYHFSNVDSNDVLYSSDEDFHSEIEQICSLILDQVLKLLHTLGNNQEHDKQAQLSFELFCLILIRTDITDLDMAKLALNLMNLAKKHNALDKRIAIETVKHCLNNSFEDSSHTEIYTKFLSKLDN